MQTSGGGEPKAQTEWRVWFRKSVNLIYLIWGVLWLVAEIRNIEAPGAHHHSLWRLAAPVLVVFGSSLGLSATGLYATFGPIEGLHIFSPVAEERIRKRYEAPINRLTALGFNQLFIFGEAYSIFRLLLIVPAIILVLKLLRREVMSVQNGKVVTAYPILAGGEKSAFAHPFGLGVKFHTAFEDSTLLISKTFVGDTTNRPGIVVQQRQAGISEMWAEHQQRMRELEASGKRVNRDTSFPAYSEISRRESAPIKKAP